MVKQTTVYPYNEIPVATIMKLRKKALGYPRSVYTFLYKYYINKTHSFIPLSASLGNNIIFPHGLNGIFISGGAVIGNSCVLFHQMTIGSNTLANTKGKGAPIIGNNIYIGAGVKVIGNVHVGNNVRISAICIVTHEVPENTTVVMPKPIYVFHSETFDNTFIPYKKFQNVESFNTESDNTDMVVYSHISYPESINERFM